ncbi:MAG: indolepyruvate oxidoreductase subunit beta [Planctomycetes bacterium GWF2_42_9]|nr:MAG: indolepyruvate oxidoreductase subunit beta [Planctomycetes bacterium GWF2_42_9]HAL44428.1 indolepyruvate oxidoreductase subunit beta [Phycisphaerales bacterium]
MTDNKITSIVLAGVGGQGILLASEISAQAAMLAGYDVKTNEVHGMAQRGGSVLAQIRYGKKVYSPLVAKGTASVLVTLEQIEALRFADYLADDGFCVANSQAIIPVTVSMGAAKYPQNVKEMLDDVFKKLVFIDAAKVAIECGNIRAANTVLLGAMSNHLDLPHECWHKAIEVAVKGKYTDLNIKAFEAGRNYR